MIEKISFQRPTPQLDATNLLDLLDLYLADQRKRVSAYETSDTCRQKLSYFRRFWTEHALTYNNVLTPSVLADFTAWLDTQRTQRTGEPLSYNTRYDACRRLRQVLRWAWRNEYLKTDWSQYAPLPAGQSHEHNALSLIDCRAIFDQCFASSTQLRDTALLAIFLGTGCRRAEAANIRVVDVKFVDGLSGLIALTVTKNSTPRQIAFDSVAGRYLRLYLDRQQPTGYLFPGRLSDTPIGDETVGRIFKRHATAAGVAGFTGCHDFRRTFSTQWILRLPGEGYGSMLARQLGHKIPSLTFGTYNKLSAEDIRRCMDLKRVSAFAQMMA